MDLWGGLDAEIRQGLTLNMDWYHIDLRNVEAPLDPGFIVNTNFRTATKFAANGAPLNGQFQSLITRDPVTGAILNVNSTEQNLTRILLKVSITRPPMSWIPRYLTAVTSERSRLL